MHHMLVFMEAVISVSSNKRRNFERFNAVTSPFGYHDLVAVQRDARHIRKCPFNHNEVKSSAVEES